jgi:hypothetical protein
MTESVTHSNALQSYTFPGSKYSNPQRIEAAVTYMVHGSLAKTSKAFRIPITTLYDWKKSEWWVPLTDEVRHEKEDEFRAGFSGIIETALFRAKDALGHGDTKLVKTKEGYEERRVPVSAKDAMVMAAIAYDKLRLSENLPTTITQSENSKSLQAQLEELSDRLDEREKTVVSDQ